MREREREERRKGEGRWKIRGRGEIRGEIGEEKASGKEKYEELKARECGRPTRGRREEGRDRKRER